MACRHRFIGDRRAGAGMARGGHRVLGAGGAVAALLSFGLSPLAAMPRAQADGFDDLIGDFVVQADGWFDPGATSLATVAPMLLDLAGSAPGSFDGSDVANAADVDPTGLTDSVTAVLAQVEQVLFNIINLPTALLFGVNLVGTGCSIGDACGLLGQIWDGHNDAVLSFLSFGWNLGDGGLLFGNGGDAAELTGITGVYDGGSAFLFGSDGTGSMPSTSSEPGFLHYDFKNDTGLPDDDVYVTVIGQTSPGHWAWIGPDGMAHPLDHDAANAAGHLTKDGVNYANMSFTLAHEGQLSLPPTLEGARIMVSEEEPLYIGISADNSGWAVPNPAYSSDPNYDTTYDWFEYTYKYGTVHFGGNTTQVDQFGIPYTFTLTQDASGFDATRGLALSQDQVFQQYTNTVPKAFDSLIVYNDDHDPVRILSPRTFVPDSLTHWLDPEIQKFWSDYAENSFIYSGAGYTVKGSVDSSDNLFTYTVTPTHGSPTSYTMAEPTTAQIFAADGPFVGTGQQGAFLAQLDAAFNRGVATSPGDWATVADYYPAGGDWNNWAQFFHTISLDHFAYGFPFDDVNSQSSVLILSNSQPPTTLSFDLK